LGQNNFSVHEVYVVNHTDGNGVERRVTFPGVHGQGDILAWFPNTSTGHYSVALLGGATNFEDGWASVEDTPIFRWTIDLVVNIPVPGNTILRDVSFVTNSSSTIEGFGSVREGFPETLTAQFDFASVSGIYTTYKSAPTWHPVYGWSYGFDWQEEPLTMLQGPLPIEVDDVVFTRIPAPNSLRVFRGVVSVAPTVLASTVWDCDAYPGGQATAYVDNSVTLSEVKPPD